LHSLTDKIGGWEGENNEKTTLEVSKREYQRKKQRGRVKATKWEEYVNRNRGERYGFAMPKKWRLKEREPTKNSRANESFSPIDGGGHIQKIEVSRTQKKTEEREEKLEISRERARLN